MSDLRVVPVPLVPVRAEPTHRAERVTEWVLGEVVRVVDEREGWFRTRGEDGYYGWVPAGPFDAAAFDAADWAAGATLVSLGTGVEESSLLRLPWGSRLLPGEAGRVVLPDGRAVRPRTPDRLVAEAGRAERLPATGEAVVASARAWEGVPYAWGGRTECGVDCSGFVQSVYRLHGVPLPRDSRDQRECGAGLDPDARDPDALLPGDLVFFAPEGHGITHVAVSLGGARILHAAASNGWVAEEDLEGDRPLARRLAASIVARTRPLARPADG